MAYVATDRKPPNLRHFMEMLISPLNFDPMIYDELVIKSSQADGKRGLRAVHAVALDSARPASPPLAIFDRQMIRAYKQVCKEI